MAKVSTGAAGIIFNYVNPNAQAPIALGELIAFLVANNMASVMSYGTGTAGSYSSTGAGWTKASMSNTLNCWTRFRMNEARQREYVFQCQNNGSGRNNQVVGMYSANAGFIGGSPSATVIPTATDQGSMGTVTNLFGDAASIRINILGFTNPINGVLPWYLYCNALGGTNPQGIICHDAIIAGSYDGTDPDPCVQTMAVNWSGSTIRFWTGYGTGSPVYNSMTAASAQLGFDGAKAIDPTSGKDIAGRYLYYSASIHKGYSHGVLVKGQARAYPNNINKASDAFTYIGAGSAGILLPSPNNLDLAL